MLRFNCIMRCETAVNCLLALRADNVIASRSLRNCSIFPLSLRSNKSNIASKSFRRCNRISFDSRFNSALFCPLFFMIITAEMSVSRAKAAIMRRIRILGTLLSKYNHFALSPVSASSNNTPMALPNCNCCLTTLQAAASNWISGYKTWCTFKLFPLRVKGKMPLFSTA